MLFGELAKYLERLESEASRLKMTEILVELLRAIDANEAKPVSYLLMGRLAPRFVDLEFNLAEKMVMRAMALVSKQDLEYIQQEFKKRGDLGLVAEELLFENIKTNKTEELTLLVVYERLVAIAKDSGQGSQERKIEALASLLSKLDNLGVKYVVRMVLSKLRLGFSDKTLLDALSVMERGDKSGRKALTSAYQKATDIGWLVQMVKEKGIDKATREADVVLGVPIEPALCSRLKTAKEMFDKMGAIVAEPKFDGTRVQIHWRRGSDGKNDFVRSFTRNLKDSSHMFPELRRIGKQLQANEVILDGEGIGIDPETKKMLLFQQTITRKRKHEVKALSESIPIRFYIFDLLYIDGESLIRQPLMERRKRLEATISKGKVLQIDEQRQPKDPEELKRYHADLLANGLEGAVVKQIDGAYTPGRLGWNWVKFKEAEEAEAKLSDTLDCVVLGYWHGEGKRAQFGMGKLLLGLVHSAKSELEYVSISRLGTGMSESQLVTLRQQLEPLVVAQKPSNYVVDKTHWPDFWVKPSMVLEVAADEITVSKTHSAGKALRFPRLVRRRDDKGPEQATTTKELDQIG